MPTELQIRRLYAIAASRGWSHAGVKTMLEANYKLKTSRDLTAEQYDQVCTFLEKSVAADVVSMGRDKNTLEMFPESDKSKEQ